MRFNSDIGGSLVLGEVVHNLVALVEVSVGGCNRTKKDLFGNRTDQGVFERCRDRVAARLNRHLERRKGGSTCGGAQGSNELWNANEEGDVRWQQGEEAERGGVLLTLTVRQLPAIACNEELNACLQCCRCGCVIVGSTGLCVAVVDLPICSFSNSL